MWRLKQGQALAHRGWDNEFVLYNDLSGDTHLLGADAMQVLLQLSTGPRDAAALAHALGGTDDDTFKVLLAELAALALIEPA
jgi:PqqD family protein of HPr-rel-A system